MTNYLARIGVFEPDGDPMPDLRSVADPLSDDARMFVDFLEGMQDARGNFPRILTRQSLLNVLDENLTGIVDPSREECFMEEDHGSIQWLFPIGTEGLNEHAPVLTDDDFEALKKNPHIRSLVYQHFLLFAKFMGMNYDPSTGVFEKVHAGLWRNWIMRGHNNLRITRVLTALKKFGLEELAQDFLDFLVREFNRFTPEIIGDQTFIPYTAVTRDSAAHYWLDALK